MPAYTPQFQLNQAESSTVVDREPLHLQCWYLSDPPLISYHAVALLWVVVLLLCGRGLHASVPCIWALPALEIMPVLIQDA